MLKVSGVLGLLALTAAISRAENWPQFLGPNGDGHAPSEAKLPLVWSESENVRWKTPIHGRGWSSPVIWEKQIWLTTATPDGKKLSAICVDRDSGQIVHDILLFGDHAPEPIHSLNSYASPTPVIEPGRVYVHFGTYGTACLDTGSGQTLWTRRDLNCNHYRGPGSSPLLFRDMLFLHYDGFDVQYVVALDKRTGKTLWKTDRSTPFGNVNGDFRKAFCTPIVIKVGEDLQLISPGSKAAMAYNPFNGEELWRVRYPQGHSTTSRPMMVNGLVLINTGFGRPELWAVRPDGHGDVTDTHVVWKAVKGISFKPSPLVVAGLVYAVSDGGTLTCIDGQSGELLWQERLGGEYSASPLYAAGRIHVFSHEGQITVVAPGRTFQKLAENRLDSGFMASPAVSGNALFLRTKTHLYRIEESGKDQSGAK